MFFHQTGEQRRADGDNVIVKVVAGVVHHATALLPFLAIAEQEVAARASRSIKAKSSLAFIGETDSRTPSRPNTSSASARAKSVSSGLLVNTG